MQSREVIAKARFAMLLEALPKDLVLMVHKNDKQPEKSTYSLQVIREDKTGRQWSVPIAEVYTKGEVEE